MDPTALPAGASPSCSDVSFLPGGVFSRPCLQKIFTVHVYPNTTVMLLGPEFPESHWRNQRNLYLYSNGGMTIEYPFQAPGVEAALLDSNGNPVILPPGSLHEGEHCFRAVLSGPV